MLPFQGSEFFLWLISDPIVQGLLSLTLPIVFGTISSSTQQEDGILKDYYEDFISEHTNNKVPLSDLFRWEQAEYAGRAVEYRAHVTRNVSPMFVGEDGAFADAGAQGHIPVRIQQRKMMARIRMTSESMYDSRKSEGAYVSNKKDEMSRIVDDIARREEYAINTIGNGVLAFVDDSDPDSSATVTVDSPGGIANDNFGNRFILEGMYVGFVNPATGVLRSGVRRVASVSTDGTSIVLDSAAGSTVADNDYIVQVANSSVTDVLDSSFEKAFRGFMGLVDDGTYVNNYDGVDRSVYGNHASYVKASTGALSTDVLQQVSDAVSQKLGGMITRVVGHHSTRRLFIQLTDPDRRYGGDRLTNPDPLTRAFTQDDLTMGEVPFTAIRDFPLDVMGFIDEKGADFVRYGTEKGKWVDEDGRILIRVGTGSAGRDAFEAWYRKRYQNHCRQPAKCARLDGITGHSLIVVRAE
jgi:hypothetical protein